MSICNLHINCLSSQKFYVLSTKVIFFRVRLYFPGDTARLANLNDTRKQSDLSILSDFFSVY